ncbi:hypothetical protein D0T49_01595 [Paludibacter sp. 221]|uniref:hypothetical protein n=1 Tax=Paludibacter sp. 221 TaxID=2302939 RepID=UPI0013CFAE3B|nr:hypothetical protein [Paludibacter sp. 221]NDV45744.1 hypothetical protein [Paludibacter sp. 221]
MNIYKITFFLFLSCTLSLIAQDKNLPIRTPEQEATRQTERLQQELNLTPEQTRKVYEINLRYARQRQQSNTRSEAMERTKNKDADLKRVLNNEQYNQLRDKHYERSTYKIPADNQRPVIENSRQTIPSQDNRSTSPSRSNSTQTDSQRTTQPSGTPTRTNNPASTTREGNRPVRESTNQTTPTDANKSRNSNTSPTRQPEGTRSNSSTSTRKPTYQPMMPQSRNSGYYNNSRTQQQPSRQQNINRPAPSQRPLQGNSSSPASRSSGGTGSRQSTSNSNRR